MYDLLFYWIKVYYAIMNEVNTIVINIMKIMYAGILYCKYIFNDCDIT